MTEAELLTEVKKALGITGDYQNGTLSIYIGEVLEYLSNAGVPADKLLNKYIVGVVARGVSDLWNYGASGGKLSDYFMQRVTQLAYTQEV